MNRLSPEWTEKWVEELQDQLKNNVHFLKLHMQLCKLEPLYNEIIDSLPPEQQEIAVKFRDINLQVEINLAKTCYERGLRDGSSQSRKKPILHLPKRGSFS